MQRQLEHHLEFDDDLPQLHNASAALNEQQQHDDDELYAAAAGPITQSGVAYMSATDINITYSERPHEVHQICWVPCLGPES